MRVPGLAVAESASKVETELSALLVSVEAVEILLGVRARTIYRLVDGGKMPRPLRIGGSNRWKKTEILAWLDAGCPASR